MREEDVKWIVNDIGELGVKIGDQLFFCYKGRSLSYAENPHYEEDIPENDIAEGQIMRWRYVGKREFGECVHPINYPDHERATRAGHPVRIGTVSRDDGNEWFDHPVKTPQSS